MSRALRTRRGTNTIPLPCCQPLVQPLRWHSCIPTSSSRIGTRSRCVLLIVRLCCVGSFEQDWHSDTEPHTKGMRTSIELPPLRRSNLDPTSDPYNPLNVRPRDHLSALLSNSPPGRSSTLPPIQRQSPNRPRKQSVSKRAREPQHRRQKSKESQLYNHMRRMSYDRKAYSAEPSSGLAAYGKRWEDLIDAATSATEDVNEDRTPVSPLCAPHPPHHPNQRTDAAIPANPPLPTLRQPLLPPPLLRLPLPRLPSLAAATSPHAARLQPRRALGARTLPLGRVRRRLLARRDARGLESRRRAGHPDLLRGVPGGEFVEGELCVYGVYLWDLSAVCGCVDGGAGGQEEVSEVCDGGGEV
jgi:hypothetical protein